ncbi:MAG: hypothetical protein U0Q11_22870 [Vicinamibacterales bacterium]
MKRQLAMVAMCACLVALGATPALAQRVDASGVPFRTWDVHAGTGLQFLTSSDRVAAKDNGWSTPSPLGDIAVARYWTSHLKTEVGLIALTKGKGYRDEAVTLASGAVAHSYNSLRARQQQVVMSGIYQFFDNEFAHPYVSAGVRVGRLDIESRRSPYGTIVQGNTYQSVLLPEITTRQTEIKVRPFVALGSKAYFSERVFARPEFMVAVSRTGISQLGLNLGFGVDF